MALYDDSFCDAFLSCADEFSVWLLSLTCKHFRSRLCRHAFSPSIERAYSSSNMMKFALSCGFQPSEKTIERVAELGSFGSFIVARAHLTVELDQNIHLAAVRGGKLSLLKWLHAATPWPILDPSMFSMAAKRGDVRMLEYLHRMRCPWDERTTLEAADQKRWEVLLWALEMGCQLHKLALNSILSNGSIELFERVMHYHGHDVLTHRSMLLEDMLWIGRIDLVEPLRRAGFGWTRNCFALIARTGDRSALRKAVDDGCPLAAACEEVSTCVDPTIWKTMHEEYGIPVKDFACQVAARIGDLGMIQWARSIGVEWDGNTVVWAASKGHLNIIEWAHAQGCPLEARASSSAARSGHIEVLRWLRAHGCPWNEFTTSAAAASGNIEVLRWAHEHGCPWNEHTCSAAAAEGHLDALKWARERDCPWDEYTCFCAMQENHVDVLGWALENGCRSNELCNVAVRTGNLVALRLALSHGCSNIDSRSVREPRCVCDHELLDEVLRCVGIISDPSLFNHILKFGTLKCLKVAHRHGYRWNAQSGPVAAKRGKLHVLRWMKEQGYRMTHLTALSALIHGKLEIVQWAFDGGCRMQGMDDTEFVTHAMKSIHHSESIACLVRNGIKLAPKHCELAVQMGLDRSVLITLINSGCVVNGMVVGLMS